MDARFALFFAFEILNFFFLFHAGAKPEIRKGEGLVWGSGGGAPSTQKFCIFLQK